MRRELLLVSCVFAACRPGGYPDLRFERVPADPRFGTGFAQASPLRTGTFSSAWNADGLYVAILEDPGLDTGYVEQPSQMRAYRVDPATGRSTRLPDPPFPPFHSEWGWATPWVPAFHGAGMILVEESADWRRILIYEGGWRQVEYPNGYRTADSIAARPGGQIAFVVDHRALTYDGLNWDVLPIPSNAREVKLGPWDDAGLCLVVGLLDDSVNVMLFDVNARIVKHEATLPGVLALGFPRFQNGTTSDFRFDAFMTGSGHRSIHYVNGSFVPGPDLPTAGALVLDTPGAPVLAGLATASRFIDHLTFGPFFKVDTADALVVTGTQGRAMSTSCPCDRELDAKCACLPRGTTEAVLMHEARLSPAGDAISVLFADSTDGVLRYSVRRIDLPFQTTPLDEPFTAP